VEVSLNDALASLDGLETLERIGDARWVLENPVLARVDGLASLAELGHASFASLPALLELHAFAPSVRFAPVEDYAQLTAYDLPALVDLDGLAHVQDVEVGAEHLGIQISDAPALVDVAGLAGFFGQGSRVSLQLDHLSSLPAVELAGVDEVRDLYLAELPALESLAGLGSLRVAERFAIRDAPALTSLAGLEMLAAVDDTLSIGGCFAGPTGIASLAGLEGLDAVGTLEIAGQPDLATLAGLPTSIGLDDLVIRHNPLLATDEVDAWVSAAAPSGDVIVCSNAGGLECERGPFQCPPT
jgi:hypothetical protein